MKRQKQFPWALRSVVARHAGGNQSVFAEGAGITAATVSRLCAGTRDITRETLEKIAGCLPEDERRRLYLAAVRDFLPDEAREMFFPEERESPLVLREDEPEPEPLDGEVKRFLQWLHGDARRSKETEAWLRTLARWVAPAGE